MDLIWSWADKTHLAPLRLVNFIVLAYLIAAVAVHRPRIFTFRPLAFLDGIRWSCLLRRPPSASLFLTQPQLFATFTGRTVTAITMVGLLFPVAWLAEMATKTPVDAAGRSGGTGNPAVRLNRFGFDLPCSWSNTFDHGNRPASDWRSKSVSSSKSTV